MGPIEVDLDDSRSWILGKHTLPQMTRHRIYQMAARHEDCNDMDFLWVNSALRLATGKGDEARAGQSGLSKSEIEVLGFVPGLKVLEDSLMRSNDLLMRRIKQHPIPAVDLTEDPAHGK